MRNLCSMLLFKMNIYLKSEKKLKKQNENVLIISMHYSFWSFTKNKQCSEPKQFKCQTWLMNVHNKNIKHNESRKCKNIRYFTKNIFCVKKI